MFSWCFQTCKKKFGSEIYFYTVKNQTKSTKMRRKYIGKQKFIKWNFFERQKTQLCKNDSKNGNKYKYNDISLKRNFTMAKHTKDNIFAQMKVWRGKAIVRLKVKGCGGNTVKDILFFLFILMLAQLLFACMSWRFYPTPEFRGSSSESVWRRQELLNNLLNAASFGLRSSLVS